MNITKPVKYIIHTLCVAWAFSHAAALHAEPVSALNYFQPYTSDVASIEKDLPVTSNERSFASKQHDFFKSQRKTNSDRVGSFVYKSIDDPDKVVNQAASSVLLYGLAAVGLGDSVREGVEFIKELTRYSFGSCGDLKLNPGTLTATSCMAAGGNIELNSDYDFDSVSIKFRWSL